MSLLNARGQPPDGNAVLGGNNSTDGAGSSDPDAWWWSASAEAVKWGVVAGIFLIFFLGLMGSYAHAKHRMKNGLQPLPYHRWLVRRHERTPFESRNENGMYGHNMHPYAAPPPAYNPEHDYVPPYAPPEEGSKIKLKEEEATLHRTDAGPSQPLPVANPPRPMYS